MHELTPHSRRIRLRSCDGGPSQRRIAVLQRSLLRECAELRRLRRGLPQEALERRLTRLNALQFVIGAYWSANRRSRPWWARYDRVMAGAVAGFTLFLLVAYAIPTPVVPAELDLHLTYADIQFAPSRTDSPLQLGFDMPLRSLRVSGLDSVQLGNWRAPPLPVTNPLTHFELDAPISGTAGDLPRVTKLTIPARARMTLKVTGDRQLQIQLAMPPPSSTKFRAASQESLVDQLVRIECTTPAASLPHWNVSAGPEDIERSAPEDSGLCLVVGEARLRADAPISISLGMAAGPEATGIPLGLQRRAISELRVIQPVRGEPIGESGVVKGQVRFIDVDAEPHHLALAELLRLGVRAARISELYFQTGFHQSGDDSAQRQLPELRLRCQGEFDRLDGGARPRDLRPSLLMSLAGNRERLYFIGVVIYAGIFGVSLVRREPPGAADSLQPAELIRQP